MTETLQIWIAGLLGSGVIGSFIWQWAHRQDCENKRIANAKALAEHRGDLDYLLHEVGQEHNEGMRARLHFLENRVRADSER